jgi:hypothetical protein
MLENNAWVDDSRIDYFVNQAVERDVWLAPREGRAPRTAEQILADLAAGAVIQYANGYWYGKMRDADAIKPRKPSPAPEMVECDCGHTVPVAQRMNASMGTSCPDCYDRMSD